MRPRLFVWRHLRNESWGTDSIVVLASTVNAARTIAKREIARVYEYDTLHLPDMLSALDREPSASEMRNVVITSYYE